MAGQQRKCANCRFYSDAGMPGNGWCTHPKRQLNSGVKLLVRAGELACRNTWGGDLFQSRLEDDASPAAAADLPGNDQDDEVTSVTIRTNQHVPVVDRVVRDHPSIRRPHRLDSNDAAHRDQEERARVMARGSRDALAQARQRFTSRHQPRQQDVVADDDSDESASSDRVVTRQQRFSDRDFASGLPPLKTAPVPREEIRQRNAASEDRFDTVPEINPDFDMPGQRRRSEPVATSAPEPETPAEQANPPEIDQDQLTAYEHVLQRARRIRETKQDRARPIRRAALLHHRDDTEQDAFEVRPEPDLGPDPRESQPAFDEPESLERAAAPIHDEPAWIDEYDAPASSIDNPTGDAEDFWDGEAAFRDEVDDIGQTAEAWTDEDDVWDEDESDWIDDDAGVYEEPAPRRLGWLGRLGFGRRSAAESHDDAMVTRHSSSTDLWAEDDRYEYDDEPFEDGLDTDVYADDDRIVASWEHNPIEARGPYEYDRPEERGLYDREQIYLEPELEWSEDERLEQSPDWLDDDDDLPPWSEAHSPAAYAEEFPDPAPVPAPVPAAERAGDAWDVAGMPVRPVPASRPRQRLTAELPDLDDALFDDDRVLRAERPPVVSSEPEAPTYESRVSSAPSARDSYFRASRYPHQEHASPFRDGPAPEAPVAESTLPDIESDRLDVRDAVARGAELIDRQIDVAPEVPRQCRTCRSFRSADGGTRGWCTNEWAFTHRRMVNEDDLACVSAIGCWWMPADHLRLDLDEELDDVPTPRMDELIARHSPAARKASGE